MKKHIFLTGEVQVGKSTAISRALGILKVVPGGFRTYGMNYQEDGSSDVYIFPAVAKPEQRYRVAHRSPAGISVYPEVFDEFGTYYLRQPANLILMDELGYMEAAAEKFQQAVLETLDGDVPVLGVVRNRKTPFLDAVRAREDVLVLTVTESNRNFLPKKIAYFIGGLLQKQSA